MSARTKVEGWFTISDSAYALFRDEYKLPLLQPELAAQMATVAEHLSVLLVLPHTPVGAGAERHDADDLGHGSPRRMAHPSVVGGADVVPGGACAGSVSLDRALGIGWRTPGLRNQRSYHFYSI